MSNKGDWRLDLYQFRQSSSSQSFFYGTFNREYYVFSTFNVFVYNYYPFIYQHAGDAKNPYLAQYSAVVEDSPVITSWISMKINILIKNIPIPLNIHFNTFLIEFFLANVANIINNDCI
jgi:hypothetical protein